MNCKSHENQAPRHGEQCGHKAIQHGDHTDYLHDGHLHSAHIGHYDEHALSVNADNPNVVSEEHLRITSERGHVDLVIHERTPTINTPRQGDFRQRAFRVTAIIEHCVH